MTGVRLSRRGRDQGLTLVEVLLVTAVIGVLVAITSLPDHVPSDDLAVPGGGWAKAW